MSDNALAGAPCWIDLTTSDPERSREFYARLFGWTPGEPNEEFGGYFEFFRDGAPVAGGMQNRPEFGAPDQWAVYLSVADARKTMEAALAKGARQEVEPMEVGDLGTMAVITDPGGATIGMWQAGTFDGFAVTGAAGAPSWFELLTGDYATAVEFYRDVFGWDAHVASDTPEFRYTTLGKDHAARAGIMDATAILGPDEPGGWSVYFGVDDADAALARVRELGGTVVRPAEDTPHGRLATAVDPTGVRFKIVAR